MSLLPISFLEWADGLALSAVYRESLWLFPVTQALHLVALAIFVGALLIVDLRLLGLGVTQQPRAAVAGAARPWLAGSFVALFITGVPQFTANALRYYDNPPFTIKFVMLAAALLFTFTVRRRVAHADEARVSSITAGAVGIGSILLWAGVTVGGRAIGFY